MPAGNPTKKRGCWRPLLAYLVVLLLVALAVGSFFVNHIEARYEASLDRDPETGVIRGFEPILLNTERRDRAVLLVHGFIGAPQNYNRLPYDIAAAGWRVEAMRLPGCGTTPRDQERTSLEALRAGVEERLRLLQEECDTVVLIGHSQGGALSTLAAAALKPDGLVLFAPYYGLTGSRWGDHALRRVTRAISPVLRWVPEKGGSINLVENEDKIRRYGWVAVGAGLIAMESCEAVYTEEAWKEITMPVMVVHSRNDKVTSPKATEAIFPKLASEDKTLHWLEESNHVYFWDYDAERVSALTLDFLKRWETADTSPDSAPLEAVPVDGATP